MFFTKFKFECQQCGNCCRGKGSVQFLMTNLYLREGEPCPFLEDNKCRIYEQRPEQCSTWPYWGMSQTALRQAAKSCPGIRIG